MVDGTPGALAEPPECGLSSAVITAARDESEDLDRLVGCLREQLSKPLERFIVDNGSIDATTEIASRVGDDGLKTRLIVIPGSPVPRRGAQIRRVRDHFRDQQKFRHLLTRFRQAMRRAQRKQPRSDLLLVADAGGHLLELVLLSERLTDFSRTWVTQDKADSRCLLRDENVVFAYGPTCRSIKNLLRNVVLAWRVVGQVRPQAVVTTGAAASVPFAWAAWLRTNAVVIFVEIFGSTRPSLSCRLVRPIANRVYVQWPELVSDLPGSVYVAPSVGEK
jgi:hypothetical protein